MTNTHYAIVTFGRPTFGRIRSYYTSLESAIIDAKGVKGGSCTAVRILECSTRSEATAADISDRLRVVWSS